LGVALAAAGCGAPDAAVPERIVLVTIDTLRADRVGCYGASEAHTPNLDTIAARGVRFEVAVSPAPLTLPAHASLMTGLDPPGHGVRHNSVHRLGEDIPTLAEHLRTAGYATAAFVGALVLDRRFGLDRGFDHYDDAVGDRVSGPTGFPERPADAVVDAALTWLGGTDGRFFLWVHLFDPHVGYRPPPGFASAFASRPYEGEIAFADAELGRLLARIRARFGDAGLAVVATADHGESLGEHGELTHSYSIYDATQRIPLLVEGPGLPAGRVAPGPVSLLDVAPTLLAWAGAAPLPGAAGRDLRELARATEPDGAPIYLETLATQLDFGWSPLLGLRAGRFKYIRAPRPELYDLALDPGETRNLADAEPARVAELDRRLDQHLRAGPARPPEPAHLAPGERERLRALGYLAPEDPEPASLGQMGGADPKDGGPVLRDLALAQLALLEGRPQEALERLDRLPGAGRSLVLQRAAAALAAGRPERAEAEARAALEAAPARTDARVLLAQALAAQGRLDEADGVLAALPPDVAPAPWVAIGAARAELAQGQSEAALRRLEQARARHPADPELPRAQATLLEAKGRLEAALAAREAALALAPQDPGAQNDVAWTLLRLHRDADRAHALAADAVARGGDRAELLDTLATAQLALGDEAAALETIERALPSAEGATRDHLLELRTQARATPDGAGAGAGR
jgi:arylsulfatase A-like enzyme/thioredoxin-like negative regulator of GroEL